jgi:hypothetical protein
MAKILEQVICITAGDYLGEPQTESGSNLISPAMSAAITSKN